MKWFSYKLFAYC